MPHKKLPIFIALDVDDEKTALLHAQKLSPYVLGFKIGPRLYFRSPAIIKNLSHFGKVFLDFKFYDIPSTYGGFCRAGFELGADYITVHAAAGTRALSKMAEVEKKFKGQVLAVTVLTSFEGESKTSVLSEVCRLTETVYQSGLRGLVASPHEVLSLKEKYPDLFIVTPGIRLSETKDGTHISNEDQKRTMDPISAFRLGADALVMGRSILQAKDPVQLLCDIATSMTQTSSPP